jgi:hypothetical protein
MDIVSLCVPLRGRPGKNHVFFTLTIPVPSQLQRKTGTYVNQEMEELFQNGTKELSLELKGGNNRNEKRI